MRLGTVNLALGILGVRDPRIPEVARLRRVLRAVRDLYQHPGWTDGQRN